MAARIERLDFRPAPGRSAVAMTWLAHLDDQTRLLAKDLKNITAAELQWQLRPGMNTIGMLLVHLAMVEVIWLTVAEQRPPLADLKRAVGLGRDDDAMPNEEYGGRPPAKLKGRPLKYYLNLLQRARAHTKRIVRRYADADLKRAFTRTRLNGERQHVSVRWILYHVAEHFSGHYGQILMLRHLYKDRGKRP